MITKEAYGMLNTADKSSSEVTGHNILITARRNVQERQFPFSLYVLKTINYILLTGVTLNDLLVYKKVFDHYTDRKL